MVRKVGLGALGALLTLSFATIPRANAQSLFDPQYTGDFTQWSEARRVRAVDAINKMDLSEEEIASILPLIRDLEDSERMRRADIDRLEHEMLFDGRNEVSVESRMAEINTMHRDRVTRIWETISDRIGADRAMTLRRMVDDSMQIDQTAYYQSDRIARIDSIMVEWDKATAARVAAHEEYNRKLAEQVAALAEHDQRVAREEADAKLQRERALAAAQPAEPAPPVVAVTPVEPTPVPAETAVQPAPAQQPARAFRSTPARQEQRRTRRVRGLG
jgi:hypothetical protein